MGKHATEEEQSDLLDLTAIAQRAQESNAHRYTLRGMPLGFFCTVCGVQMNSRQSLTVDIKGRSTSTLCSGKQ